MISPEQVRIRYSASAHRLKEHPLRAPRHARSGAKLVAVRHQREIDAQRQEVGPRVGKSGAARAALTAATCRMFMKCIIYFGSQVNLLSQDICV